MMNRIIKSPTTTSENTKVVPDMTCWAIVTYRNRTRCRKEFRWDPNQADLSTISQHFTTHSNAFFDCNRVPDAFLQGHFAITFLSISSWRCAEHVTVHCPLAIGSVPLLLFVTSVAYQRPELRLGTTFWSVWSHPGVSHPVSLHHHHQHALFESHCSSHLIRLCTLWSSCSL